MRKGFAMKIMFTSCIRMLKKTKYNDNSTEEEYSESEFLDLVTNSTNPPLRFGVIAFKCYLK